MDDRSALLNISLYNLRQVFAIDINICYNAVLLQLAGEEWGENEKDWVEKVVEKTMAAVFNYDRARGIR